MDRQIVFPGSIPLDTDLLGVQRNVMVALGALAQAALGGGTVVDGLACAPTVPASMSVTVGAGSITELSVMDALSFGSLPAMTAEPLVKMGVNLDPVTFPVSAPTGSGQAVNYLIQATLAEYDATPVVLPYYNAANPAQPWSGPSNSGVAQNTQRLQRVQLQMKPGAPAPAGTQPTPAVDPGWVGLWVVTVTYGASSVGPSAIAQMPNAPVIPFKLPQLTPGFSRQAAFPASTTWIVPPGVTQARVRVWGGGAGGGWGSADQAGAGGGGGGYAEGVVALSPGQAVAVTIGGGGGGGPAAGVNGGPGGTSSFGGLVSASGGAGGLTDSGVSSAGGTASGGTLNFGGGQGLGGLVTDKLGGMGGSAPQGGQGGAWSYGGASSGQAPGGGGGGGGNNNPGGNGAAGLVVVEY